MYTDDDDLEDDDLEEYEEEQYENDDEYNNEYNNDNNIGGSTNSLNNSPEGKRKKIMDTASKLSRKRAEKNKSNSPYEAKQKDINTRQALGNKSKGLNKSSKGIKKKAVHAAGKTLKETAKVIGKVVVKATAALLANPIVLIVIALLILIILAFFIITNQFKSEDLMKSTIDNYVLLDDFSDKEENKTLIETYLKSQSMLYFKVADIDKIFDTYVTEAKNKDYKFAEQMSVEFKDGNSSLKKMPEGAVSPNDEKALLKHILMTQKYDFNNVNWIQFSRNAVNGKEITDIKVDKDLGLRYPNDDKKKLEDFTKQLYPFLQTWHIPMAMFSGSVDSSKYQTPKEVSFPYYVIARAGSKIDMSKYIIETLTITTISDTFGGYSKNAVKTQKEEWKLGRIYTFDVWFRNKNIFTPYNASASPDSSRTSTEQISREVSVTNADGTTSSYTEYGTRTTVVEVWADKLKSTIDSKGTHYTAQDVENFINDNEGK